MYRVAALHIPAQSAIAPVQSTFLEHALHGQQHFIVIERFGDIVHRALAHSINCGAQAGIAGHDQHRGGAGTVYQGGAGLAGQAQVADDEIKLIEVLFPGLLHGVGFCHGVLVAYQQFAQGAANHRFIFNNQDVAHVSLGPYLSG